LNLGETVIRGRPFPVTFALNFLSIASVTNFVSFVMPRVHIRVLELRTDAPKSRINKLFLYAETTSSPTRERRNVKGNAVLTGSASWTMTVPRQTNEQIGLMLTKRIIFGSNRVIGRCVLPLEWFPTNHVLREWFPMTADGSMTCPNPKAHVLLDVHVEHRGVGKFRAAFSTLRVIPSWSKPANADVECPAPPQVVFVVAQSDPDGNVSYSPVGAAQYASPEAFEVGAAIPPVQRQPQGDQRPQPLAYPRVPPVQGQLPADRPLPYPLPPQPLAYPRVPPAYANAEPAMVPGWDSRPGSAQFYPSVDLTPYWQREVAVLDVPPVLPDPPGVYL
jgi:hypothetical protein